MTSVRRPPGQPCLRAFLQDLALSFRRRGPFLGAPEARSDRHDRQTREAAPRSSPHAGARRDP
jgi:hypothetical protein